MSLLDPIRYGQQSSGEFNYLAATQPTGFGEYFGERLQQGFDFAISGRLTEQVTSRPEGGPIPPGVSPEIARDIMGINPDVRRLTEDEWRKLKLDRPGLEFSGGGTVEYETARTRAFDERRYRDSIIARYQGGLAGQAVGFGAAMLGGLPSPENFIPFVGPGVRAAMVARMGTIGGRAAVGATDAAIGTALADAIVLPDLARRGEDVGAADFALDLALGAVTGGLFGTGAGVLARRAEGRVRQETLATAARAVRLDGLERQADALEVAQRALADDAPVDVGPVLADALPTIKQRVEQSYIRVYHGSPHRFDRFSMDSIGTGEGAQAFGHGLYFAESRGVAESYRRQLTKGQFTPGPASVTLNGKELADQDLIDAYGLTEGDVKDMRWQISNDQGIDDALDTYRRPADATGVDPEMAGRIAAALERLKAEGAVGMRPEPGNLYGVDLAVSRDELLDWDKPLSEQPAKAREALEPLLRPTKEQTAADDDLLAELMSGEGADELIAASKDMAMPEMTGAQIYESLSGGGSNSVFGNSRASMKSAQRLREAGIKGIQYLDAGSRTEGDGSRNIVMFDDELIHIREINGTAVETPEQPHPPSSRPKPPSAKRRPRRAWRKRSGC